MAQAEAIPRGKASRFAEVVRADLEIGRGRVRTAKAEVMALMQAAATKNESIAVRDEMFQQHRTAPDITMAALRELAREGLIEIGPDYNYRLVQQQ
jgi:uncharacterized protein (UPF0548 family)